MKLKFNKSTDTEHEIKLDSTIVSVFWWPRVASVGSKAKLQVLTSFVGDGAPIKVKGKSDSGKSLGSSSGKVRNNKYVGEIEIPEDLKIGDYVYFEADLSKLGLTAVSNKIPVVPRVKVTNLQWSEKVARRGEIVKLFADVKGVREETDAALIIYEYDRDSAHDRIVELKTQVRNSKIELEWEYEYHEDTDEIPTDDELKQYGKSYNPPEYFFAVRIDDIEYGKEDQKSGLLAFKDFFEFGLCGIDGKPIADEKYVLTLPDGSERKGTLDSDGRALEKDLPPGGIIVKFPRVQERELIGAESEEKK